MKSNSVYKQIGSLIVFAIVFLVVSYLAQRYHSELALLIQSGNVLSIIGFILLTAIFVVFVIPLDIVFLIPIGTSVFGPIPTALMSIMGWTLGSTIAFGIARYFGRPVVERIIGINWMQTIENRIPKRNLFWNVVLLRMLVPVDILSYALGLIGTMSWESYILATVIGVTPFGFYFAYTGAVPFIYRVVSITVAILFATVIFYTYRSKQES